MSVDLEERVLKSQFGVTLQGPLMFKALEQLLTPIFAAFTSLKVKQFQHIQLIFTSFHYSYFILNKVKFDLSFINTHEKLF